MSPSRSAHRFLTGLAVVALSLTGAAVGAGAPAAQAYSLPRLVDVRAASHATYDRVVLEFTGAGPSSVAFAWVPELRADPSDLPVPVAGRAILRVTLHGVDAHTSTGTPTVPARTAYDLRAVVTTVRSGDFEGVVTYGIGVAARTPVSTMRLSSPSRVVVDLPTTTLTTVRRPVWFVDTGKVARNVDPPVTAVARSVLAGTPATGALDRLWAGPTPAERVAGLTFVASGSTGFTGLSIAAQVARVRLLGGCSSGGSAVATVATQVAPTLRQFPTVDWVKIYDPAGTTERPSGPVDSIPVCLEP